MKAGKILIGTSGWNYKHWRNVFYPETLKIKDELNYYTSLFQTVELNNSFYRQPKLANFQSWEQQVPKGFVYSVKANRFFTHLKKLNVTEHDLTDFLRALDGLEQKTGPVLFQLPPKWRCNLERLEYFLKLLPKGYRYVMEFREHSWYNAEVYKLLSSFNVAFCIYDLGGHQSPEIVSADFVYIRLHGPGEKYQGSYSTEALERWASLVKDWTTTGRDVYIYFDNDQSAYAPKNALQLISLTEART